MPDLVATKTMKYAGRRLQVGESFEASKRDARALIAVGKAKAADAVPKRHEYQTRVMTAADSEIAALRTEYMRVHGKRPFNGWDAEALRGKIAAAEAGDG